MKRLEKAAGTKQYSIYVHSSKVYLTAGYSNMAVLYHPWLSGSDAGVKQCTLF